jgi:hypothetical protein
LKGAAFLKKIYIIIFLGLFIINANTYAEWIDGPANIREKPNGEPLFQLNNSVKVTSDLPVNHWYLVGVEVYVKEPSLTHNAIKKGEPFYDRNGNEIGKALATVSPWTDIEYDNGLKKYKLTIAGYTFQDNIQSSSIIENALAKMINEKKEPLTLSGLRNHLDEYQYQHWFQEKDFDSYLYYKSWLHVSPGVRVALIFYKNQLCALIYTTDIKLANYQFKKAQKGYKIMYVEELDNKTKEELETYYFDILYHAG